MNYMNKFSIILCGIVAACCLSSCATQSFSYKVVPKRIKNQKTPESKDGVVTLSFGEKSNVGVKLSPRLTTVENYSVVTLDLQDEVGNGCAYNFKDVNLYVNGKSRKLYNKFDWWIKVTDAVTNVRLKKSSKQFTAGFASHLANTKTVSSSYSGYVGNHAYSGVVNSSYTDHAAASRMNRDLRSQIDDQYRFQEEGLKNFKKLTLARYLTSGNIAPDDKVVRYIAFKVPKNITDLRIEVSLNGTAHNFHYKVY